MWKNTYYYGYCNPPNTVLPPLTLSRLTFNGTIEIAGLESDSDLISYPPTRRKVRSFDTNRVPHNVTFSCTRAQELSFGKRYISR